MDVALSAYQSADASLGDVAPEAQAAIDAARTQLAGLPQLRQALNRQLLTQDAITGKYSAMITDLLNINRQIGVGTDSTELNNEVAGLTALGDLKETLSQERALLYGVTSNGGITTREDGSQSVTAAGSSSGSRPSSPRRSPSGWPHCSGSGPRPPRARSARTTRRSTARPCWRSSGWKTASPPTRTRSS